MKVSLAPYKGTLWIETEHSRATARAALLGIDVSFPESEGGRAASVNMHEFLVYLRDRDPGTLVHELTHVVLWLLQDRGVDVHASNGEPMCYMLGHLVGLTRHLVKD